jgi:hypothetical protein
LASALICNYGEFGINGIKETFGKAPEGEENSDYGAIFKGVFAFGFEHALWWPQVDDVKIDRFFRCANAIGLRLSNLIMPYAGCMFRHVTPARDDARAT